MSFLAFYLITRTPFFVGVVTIMVLASGFTNADKEVEEVARVLSSMMSIFVILFALPWEKGRRLGKVSDWVIGYVTKTYRNYMGIGARRTGSSSFSTSTYYLTDTERTVKKIPFLAWLLEGIALSYYGDRKGRFSPTQVDLDSVVHYTTPSNETYRLIWAMRVSRKMVKRYSKALSIVPSSEAKYPLASYFHHESYYSTSPFPGFTTGALSRIELFYTNQWEPTKYILLRGVPIKEVHEFVDFPVSWTKELLA